MMAARGNIKGHLRPGIFEYGRDDGDVWKMCSAGFGVVCHQDVSWDELAFVELVLMFDGIAHRAQVHWDMRSVGNEVTCLISCLFIY